MKSGKQAGSNQCVSIVLNKPGEDPVSLVLCCQEMAKGIELCVCVSVPEVAGGRESVVWMTGSGLCAWTPSIFKIPPN